MALTLLLASIALAQAADDMPYVILMDDGTRHYGFADEEDLGRSTIVVVTPDAPWLESSERAPLKLARQKIRDYDRERATERAKRYAEQWKAHGGVQVDTAGGLVWVRGEEARYAKRSRELVEKAFKVAPAEVESPEFNGGPPVGEALAGPEDSEPHGPPFGQLWGAHIAVLTLGLGIAGLATWFFILD